MATIALEVDYDSEAAFARAFKRLVGVPPATWRREKRKADDSRSPAVDAVAEEEGSAAEVLQNSAKFV